ncbi:MAG: T9SS type A sorting domain-containing protein [Bacteroidales bacterium]|nr:T9SS type A sorting domain-containing protein [Bacteroidales bacterium]
MKKLSVIALLLANTTSFGQFAPPAGQPGSAAINKDSSVIISWALTCNVTRGYINIADTFLTYNGSNKASYGKPENAIGPADDLVVSLGDRGEATLTFNPPIINGPGPDFAVFENAFSSGFLELAFVEVSSDGQHFVRFPSVSLTETADQVGTFDTLDTRKIHNLAGKYKTTFGTPFDLQDILDSAGIDINNITHIRIVDVVGSIQSPFISYDAMGHPVNDPWPTPFDTGGFDLDAIGVIHNYSQGIDDRKNITNIQLYPNPVTKKVKFFSNDPTECMVIITNTGGYQIYQEKFIHQTTLDLSSFPSGIFFSRFSWKDGTTITKKIVKE